MKIKRMVIVRFDNNYPSLVVFYRSEKRMLLTGSVLEL